MAPWSPAFAAASRETVHFTDAEALPNTLHPKKPKLIFRSLFTFVRRRTRLTQLAFQISGQRNAQKLTTVLLTVITVRLTREPDATDLE